MFPTPIRIGLCLSIVVSLPFLWFPHLVALNRLVVDLLTCTLDRVVVHCCPDNSDRIRFHTIHKYPPKDLFRSNVFLEFVLSVRQTMRVYGVGRQWVSPVYCCYSRPPPQSVRHVNIPGVKRTVEKNVNFTENYLCQIDFGLCHVYFPSSFTRLESNTFVECGPPSTSKL